MTLDLQRSKITGDGLTLCQHDGRGQARWEVTEGHSQHGVEGVYGDDLSTFWSQYPFPPSELSLQACVGYTQMFTMLGIKTENKIT